VAYWRHLRSDPGARFDLVVIACHAAEIRRKSPGAPRPRWSLPSTIACPIPIGKRIAVRREGMERALVYMGLTPNHADREHPHRQGVHRFVHQFAHRRPARRRRSCNASAVAWPEHQAGMVVPGSGLVKAQAEAEGLDRIFRDAGFEWREPGCSMCLAMNADRLEPGERCASTSNRNFEGRQGSGGRTHLVSPGDGRRRWHAGAFRRRRV
jgi:3-isopropylmalate/(R)-2-methylmalate dehydratase large subunit